jgi:hypothetical protein
MRSYLGSVDDDDLANAVAEISTLGDHNFVAYEVLGNVRDRLEDSPAFKARLHDKIRSNESPTHFRTIAIEFIQNSMTTEQEAGDFETTLYNIARDQTLESHLRKYAAGRLGRTNNPQLSRDRIELLLDDDNPAVINGAAKAAMRFVTSPAFENDRSAWTNKLIGVANRHRADPGKIKVVLAALGEARNEAARDILSSFFREQVAAGDGVAISLARYLVMTENPELLKSVVRSLNANISRFEDHIEVEMALGNIVGDNLEALDDLASGNDTESKIAYLQGLQALRTAPNDQSIINAKALASDTDEEVALQAVKALHFLLPHEEEIVFYTALISDSNNVRIRTLINGYIGIVN